MVLLFSSMYVEYDNAVLTSSDNTTGADWEQQLVDQAKKGDVDRDEDETFVLDADQEMERLPSRITCGVCWEGS